jgi:hypothetical protein
VERYGWSLYEIDLTSVESLMPFIGRQARQAITPTAASSKNLCDQVSWL